MTTTIARVVSAVVIALVMGLIFSVVTALFVIGVITAFCVGETLMARWLEGDSDG